MSEAAKARRRESDRRRWRNATPEQRLVHASKMRDWRAKKALERPDREVLAEMREYAEEHGITVQAVIRDLWRGGFERAAS